MKKSILAAMLLAIATAKAQEAFKAFEAFCESTSKSGICIVDKSHDGGRKRLLLFNSGSDRIDSVRAVWADTAYVIQSGTRAGGSIASARPGKPSKLKELIVYRSGRINRIRRKDLDAVTMPVKIRKEVGL